MNKLPLVARLYVIGMVAGAAALLVFVGELPQLHELPVYLSLVVATVLTSMYKLRLPTTKNRATMSVSFVVDFASLLLFGPHKSLLIAAAGALSQSTLRVANKNPLHRVLFNIATLVITVQSSGVAYRLVGGTVGAPVWPHDMAALTAAVIAYFLVNTAAISTAIALSTYQPVYRVWNHNFLWGAPSYFIGAGVAALIVELVASEMWWSLPLAAVPVYMTYRAYAIFVGRLEDEHRHREVIESLNEGMAVVQVDGRVALWNDALERIMGMPRAEVLGKLLVEAVPALAETTLPETIRTVLTSGQTQTLERVALEWQDRQRILQVRIFPFLRGVTVFWNDITDRAEAETALKESEERYALAAAGSNDGLWDWDLTRGEIYLSPRWKEMLGLNQQGAYGPLDQWFGRVHPDDVDFLKAALDAHVAGETVHFEHEHRVRHQDGTYRWMLCRGVAVRKADRIVTRIAGSQTDITERAVAQEQLRHAALHDTLTGLPNRALFTELLAQVLDRSIRRPEPHFAVLFLDVDRFKLVNDSLGHLMGDELLIAVSRRLESCLRDGDVLARLGGDEFTILLNDLEDVSQASVIAQRLQDTLRLPFSLHGKDIFTTASIGIAVSLTGYDTPEHIMRDADTAMYRAKALGKARHELFDASMHARAVDRLSLENDLRRAIERGEFALHYQPIISLESGRWTGFEALIRWRRADRWVPPGEFIPVAEETGIIQSLGAWVLVEACRQMGEWRRQFPGGPDLGITVNVSTRQLNQPDFVDSVRRAVESAQLRPCDLRLEITETTLMENPDRAEVVLRELRAWGVKVYLDDFGTGFSSLSYLHRFEVDTLKIDRSFVANLESGKHQPAFVQSIVTLAHSLGTKVIAEGVETEGQRTALALLGCGEAQGFLFAGPLPARTAEALLARGETRSPVAVPVLAAAH